jgi:cysteine desulfurase
MWVNNETGAVQPIRQIAEMAVDAAVPFHTDAVQAVGKVPCSVEQSGATMLSISGHKIGAPKGCGALIMRADAAISPLLHGGGQQRGVRPGTENVACAAALATAVELAVAECDAVERSVGALRDELEHRVTTDIADIEIVASESTRAPHISNIAFGGVDAGTLLAALDLAGVACSAGSACASGSAAASHVLLAMGLPDNLIGGAVRFSFSLRNTATDVARLLNVLPDAMAKSRAARGVA